MQTKAILPFTTNNQISQQFPSLQMKDYQLVYQGCDSGLYNLTFFAQIVGPPWPDPHLILFFLSLSL